MHLAVPIAAASLHCAVQMVFTKIIQENPCSMYVKTIRPVTLMSESTRALRFPWGPLPISDCAAFVWRPISILIRYISEGS